MKIINFNLDYQDVVRRIKFETLIKIEFIKCRYINVIKNRLKYMYKQKIQFMLNNL